MLGLLHEQIQYFGGKKLKYVVREHFIDILALNILLLIMLIEKLDAEN